MARKWQSLPADEVAAAIIGMNEKDAKSALEQIRKGRVPGLSPKEQKQIEKDVARRTQGERGGGAAAAGIRDFFSGRSGTTRDGDLRRGAAKSNKPLNRDGSPRSTWW